MKQRARYVFVLALAAGGIVVSACSDDSSNSAGDGGSGGASGNKAAGSSAGGSANKAGSSHSGGDAGSQNGGEAGSGTAGASEAGGNGGAPDGGVGGSDAGAGGNAAGMAGAGGAGEPALVYACGSSTLIQKKCSALVAANCTDPTVCPDCVAAATSDREAFQNDPPCDTCNAKYDAFDQCEVDAFESGNLAFGVECVPEYGADGTDNCYPFLDEALACEGYVGSDVDPHACPASWPPP